MLRYCLTIAFTVAHDLADPSNRSFVLLCLCLVLGIAAMALFLSTEDSTE